MMRGVVDRGIVEAPWWDDRPLAIVGCGPSLRGFDHGKLCGPWRVLAVASALWKLGFADAAYDQDWIWIENSVERLRTTPVPLYLVWPPSRSRRDAPSIPSASWIAGSLGDFTLSEDPRRVECGFTSGFGALNLARLKRARRIVLFGFDYREDGRQHHADNDAYPWHLPGHLAKHWPMWAGKFDHAVPQLVRDGVIVVNASPDSNVAAFSKCSVEDGVSALWLWSREVAA